MVKKNPIKKIPFKKIPLWRRLTIISILAFIFFTSYLFLSYNGRIGKTEIILGICNILLVYIAIHYYTMPKRDYIHLYDDSIEIYTTSITPRLNIKFSTINKLTEDNKKIHIQYKKNLKFAILKEAVPQEHISYLKTFIKEKIKRE